MSNPTVLHLRSTGELLGAESVLLEMVRHGDHDRYRQIVGVLHDLRDPYPPLATRAEELGLEFRIFECRRRLDLKAIREIRDFARRVNARIVHSHGYREDLYGFIATRSLNPALIATNHNWLKSNRILRLYAWLDGKILRRFDHVVGVSAPILDEILKAGITKERCSLIPNGVSIVSSELQRTGSLPADIERLFAHAPSPLLGIVASLTPEKGHAYLVAAIQRLTREFPRISLLVIGDGPLREDLEYQAEQSGLADKVIFLGTRRDVSDLLRYLDIFVLPSLREGLPMALLEAMSVGKPVVATDVGDVRMVLDNGKAGCVIPPGDAGALCDAIADLARRPEKRADLGEKALRRVQSRFSARAMASSYMALYDRVISSDKT